MSRAWTSWLFAVSGLLAGCGGSEVDPWAPPAPSNARAESAPPHIDPLTVPDWPPFGPTSSITASCSGETTLRNISASFMFAESKSVSGMSGRVSFRGSELGEGQGQLRVTCCDLRGSCAARDVESFLVDLTAPEVGVERAVASPNGEGLDGDVALWVGDAWVLGSVELTFRGTALRYDFPNVYPSTVGKDWDVSRVTFSAKDLPLGSGDAVVVVRDAAGNSASSIVSLRIDGTAPNVALLQPSPGAAVTGPFVVKVSSTDPNDATPTRIRVWVGGAFVGELAGPVGELTLDPATLPPGPTEVRAVARDEAGNESAPVSVTVTVGL